MVNNNFDKIDGDFKYLIKMPMDSVTEENVNNINKEKSDAEKELLVLKNTTIYQMWLKELDDLEIHYLQFKKKREELQINTHKNIKKTKSKPKK
jgi:hypothetical protein